MGVNGPWRNHMRNTEKTISYLPITYRKITSMILLSSLTKSKNTYNTAGFVYVRDTYSHHMYLSHDIHMVTISTYVHDTYKCNFWTWTANNRSKYILVCKILQWCTLCISTALGGNGPWRNNIRNTEKLLHLATTYKKELVSMNLEVWATIKNL